MTIRHVKHHPGVGTLSQGSVLVAVLWCLALLFVVVIGVLHTARIDLTVTKHHGDRIQAHYLALAGIEKAKALIYQDARERSRNARNHTGDLYSSPDQFRDIQFGRGEFKVFRRATEAEGGGTLYGVSDEESRLNVNYASETELAKLYGITPDVVAAIMDWRDEDNASSPGGAELDYYLSLGPPRQPRNGPLQTVRELLMVRGVSRELLLGYEKPANGTGDPEDPDSESARNVEPGWAASLTVQSSIKNISAAGTERINIQTADERALSTLPGITADLAKAIVKYREQKRFEGIVDLLDVVPMQDETEAAASQTMVQGGRRGTSGGSGTPGGNASRPQPNTSGPKLISPALFMDIADDITTETDEDLPGVININSASLDTLICLPGVTRELAQAIISFRQSDGYLPNIGWLLKIPGFSQDVLKQIAPRISARSETYRILSEGKMTSTGTRRRIEEIVHIGLNDATTLAYQESDL